MSHHQEKICWLELIFVSWYILICKGRCRCFEDSPGHSAWFVAPSSWMLL